MNDRGAQRRDRERREERRRKPERARIDARGEAREADHAEPCGDAHRAFRRERRQNGEEHSEGRVPGPWAR